MTCAHRPPYLSLIFALLGGLAILGVGALQARHDFLTRGLPEGLPEPIPEAELRLGLVVNLEQHDGDELDINLDLIRDLGVDVVRQTFNYAEAFDWAESDRIIEAAGAHRISLIPLLDGERDRNYAPPDDLALFAAWVAQFATRYGDAVDHYIIWDEPNLASHWGNRPVNALEYAALLSAASRAIRAVDADAAIVAAPLAPTIETGPDNLAEPLYLQQLIDAGAAEAFDIVAGKPYGFDSGPDDREVSLDTLNFSRIILLRQVLEKNGVESKAIWAGNWGWNSLPDGWVGRPSIWGQTTPVDQATRTVAAFERARLEWPWMGAMFLENWQPNAPEDDPRWGFSIKGRETAGAIQSALKSANRAIAYPGFHLAREDDPAQSYQGGWRFSPDFGADISQSGDVVSLSFWGTDVGVRVRRADFRARLYVTVDGLPANALPSDENGSMLLLTSASPLEDAIRTEWVARDLRPGPHTLMLVASRGWEQWALNGFSVGYRPPDGAYRWGMPGLVAAACLFLLLSAYTGRRADWGMPGRWLSRLLSSLNRRQQLALTVAAASIVSLTGWLTWGQEAAGVYRRLGDGTQLALTAALASIFYITPVFLVYLLALLLLFLLIYLRPAWGVALIAFSFPFYVLPKPMLTYRFSPVEIFTLVAFAALAFSRLTRFVAQWRTRVTAAGRVDPDQNQSSTSPFGLRHLLKNMHTADRAVLFFALVATLSLLFTEKLDVATNEWRVLLLEPALFYFLLRSAKLDKRELWTIIDAFVLGGVLVAIVGLWQYATGQGLITAEGGLMRLRSVYGSPNNVGLYLGRVYAFLLAMAAIGTRANGRRRWVYGILLLPVSLAILLSFSRGALILGVPAATLVVFWRWQRAGGRRTWPWVFAFVAVGLLVVVVSQQTSILGGRFDLLGATSFFRLNLWKATLNMIADHPWFGVGFDNFLYAYRGRYIFDAAWQEPNLSHPHNLWLDFASRLGLFGLLAGSLMIWTLIRAIRMADRHVSPEGLPLLVGIGAALADMLGHGLVDHGIFLVDLMFAFYLMLGTSVWLHMHTEYLEPAADP